MRLRKAHKSRTALLNLTNKRGPAHSYTFVSVRDVLDSTHIQLVLE